MATTLSLSDEIINRFQSYAEFRVLEISLGKDLYVLKKAKNNKGIKFLKELAGINNRLAKELISRYELIEAGMKMEDLYDLKPTELKLLTSKKVHESAELMELRGKLIEGNITIEEFIDEYKSLNGATKKSIEDKYVSRAEKLKSDFEKVILDDDQKDYVKDSVKYILDRIE